MRSLSRTQSVTSLMKASINPFPSILRTKRVTHRRCHGAIQHMMQRAQLPLFEPPVAGSPLMNNCNHDTSHNDQYSKAKYKGCANRFDSRRNVSHHVPWRTIHAAARVMSSRAVRAAASVLISASRRT